MSNARKLANLLGTSTTVPSSKLSLVAADMPAGSIVQIVSTTKTDGFTTSSSTATDVTGFSASITPTSTSNKILVRAALNYGGNDNVYGRFFFKRGGSNIILSTAWTGSNQVNAAVAIHGDNSNFQYGTQSAIFEYLDSPSSTSQITYQMQMQSHNNSTAFYLNRPHATANSSYVAGGTSTLTLMEIVG